MQVPVVRTVVTMSDYARAVVRAWDDETPAKASVAVLWGQYMIETGGKACWNFNIGNVKAVNGDGYDYHCLSGVWEGVDPVTATRLVSTGEARLDPSADHHEAVSPKVAVIFDPPHPATRFRAFRNLDDAMRDHLALLRKRFAVAWPAVVAGDPKVFAQKLHDAHYFTASAEAYAAGMRRPFEDFMMASAYENAVAALEQDAVPTEPEVSNPASEPTIHVDLHVEDSSGPEE